MIFLPSQVETLEERTESAGFRRADLGYDAKRTLSIGDFYFTVDGDLNSSAVVRCAPAANEFAGDFQPRTWDGVLRLFSDWLEWVKRERQALDARGETVVPEWVERVHPPRVNALRAEIGRLEGELDTFLAAGRLLWQTGGPLQDAIAGCFRDFGVAVEPTSRGATYDLTVVLDTQRRLLVEVLGIDGGIQKKSNKIGQVVQTLQEHALDSDRVVVVANVHRSRPPEQRISLPVATEPALTILKGLRANVLSTVTMYDRWLRRNSEAEASRAWLDGLHEQAGGLVID